eukprot:289077_1
MANQTSTNPEWNCYLNTNYSSKSLYDDFTTFKWLIIHLMISSIVYGVFAILHDCTLIYYKDQVHLLTFHPLEIKQDFYLFHIFQTIEEKFLDYHNGLNKFYQAVSCPFAFVMAVIWLFLEYSVVLIMDLISILCVYPIISCIWKLRTNNILPICYISSSWVGIATFWMTIITTMIVANAIVNFRRPIQALSPNPHNCECYCVYYMHQNNVLGIVIATYTFVILNGKFLYSWFQETLHLQHYPYLIKYSVSINVSNQLNPTDCTGNLLKSTSMSIDMQSKFINKRYLSINEAEKEVDNKYMKPSKCSYVFRFILCCLAAIYFGWFMGLSLILFAENNNYQYAQPITTAIMVTGILLVCLSLVIILISILKYQADRHKFL